MIFLKMLHNCHDIFKNVRETLMIFLKCQETLMIFLKIVIETVMIVLEMSKKLS